MIYFVQIGQRGLVKIGYAGRDNDLDAVRARLPALQTGHPEQLILRLTEPGGRKREQELHRMFAAARQRGEWFQPTEELCEYLQWARLKNLSKTEFRDLATAGWIALECASKQSRAVKFVWSDMKFVARIYLDGLTIKDNKNNGIIKVIDYEWYMWSNDQKIAWAKENDRLHRFSIADCECRNIPKTSNSGHVARKNIT